MVVLLIFQEQDERQEVTNYRLLNTHVRLTMPMEIYLIFDLNFISKTAQDELRKRGMS